MTTTRRAFLTQAGMIAVGFGALRTSPFLLQAAEIAAPGDSILVFVLLRGGADGLSICAPYADPEYYKARPTIALPKPRAAGSDSLIDLDGYFGLHPAFRPLESLWRSGKLAIVHAAGSRDMSRSHFDAQEFLETGTPGFRGTPTGWMDRCLTHLPGSGLTQGVAFAPIVPRAFLGAEPVFVTQDIARFDLEADGWKSEAESLLREMYVSGNDAIDEVGLGAIDLLKVLRNKPALRAAAAHGARYPVTSTGLSMQQAAQAIKAGLGTRCIFVNVEQRFDTHSDQLPANAEDFANLGGSLAAFHQDLGKTMDRVVVVVATEFGRTIAEDGSHGTDHGTGGAMFVLGGPVKGGRVYGKWPGLEKKNLFEERDLDVTTDFRDVFAEVAKKHLRIRKSLFPAYTPGELPGIIA
ncbi:MAG: hypothetical protein QOI24_1311 [Acidobacteriota bacterium]|jgi:uncharacterized protein (DUF1501 family)|nr:hypothetical protein [Acidobacteriota bacterium]